MYIQKIKLENFRNYKKAEIEFDKNINIIYGDGRGALPALRHAGVEAG